MAGWTNTSVDCVVTTRPAVLYGIVLLTSAGGGDVTVYEGQDAETGRKIGRFEGANNQTRPVRFGPGLDCDRGIFVDVGSNVTEVLVIWSPRESA